MWRNVAKMIRVLVPLPEELLKQIDEARRREARASWLREAARRMLEQEQEQEQEQDKPEKR